MKIFELMIFAAAFWTYGWRTVFYDFNSLGVIVIVWHLNLKLSWCTVHFKGDTTVSFYNYKKGQTTGCPPTNLHCLILCNIKTIKALHSFPWYAALKMLCSNINTYMRYKCLNLVHALDWWVKNRETRLIKFIWKQLPFFITINNFNFSFQPKLS
jgi:hypothetical protein